MIKNFLKNKITKASISFFIFSLFLIINRVYAQYDNYEWFDITCDSSSCQSTDYVAGGYDYGYGPSPSWTQPAPQTGWADSSVGENTSGTFGVWDTCGLGGCGTVTQTFQCANGSNAPNNDPSKCPTEIISEPGQSEGVYPTNCGLDRNGDIVIVKTGETCNRCADGKAAPNNDTRNCLVPVIQPVVVGGGTTVVGGYGIAYPTVSGTWSGSCGVFTGSCAWGYNNASSINWGSYPTVNFNNGGTITNVTRVVKYECPDGSLADDYSKCPAGTCANGAIDYPTCQVQKKCVNGAINYPTCTTCQSGYEPFYPDGTTGVCTTAGASCSPSVNDKMLCVAACDVYSQRSTSTGSCVLKPCNNGALTPPYCRDCPTGKDLWNGKCVDSCPNNMYRTDAGCVAYQCSNGATDFPNCVRCPTGKYFQTDGSCRACDAGYSWNGSNCVKNACANDAINYPDCKLCITGMEYVSALDSCKYPCSNGYRRNTSTGSCDLINTQCNNNALDYPNCTQCPTGYDRINNYCVIGCASGYTRNANGNCTLQTVYCSESGVTVPITQSCPQSMKMCDNGVMVSYNSQCPINNTPIITVDCNGNRVVANAGGTVVTNCNTQMKRCADGSLIPSNTSCPFATNNINSVDTTHFSNISNKSLVCNAVANVYANMPSHGWFEWGTEYGNLNKRTPTQYIGKDNVINYAAPLTNLNPNTNYYCRAVMANNAGTYKGQIISASTGNSEVKYATSKVVAVSTSKSVKTVKQTTPTYTCKDDYGNKTTIKGGEKMFAFSIDKSLTSYSAGDKVTYTINYGNISKVAVKNIEIKINIPKEILNVKSTKGDINNNEIIYNIDELGPKGESVIIITGDVGEIENNKNITVAGVLSYDIPSRDKLRDEISAINVGGAKGNNVAPATAAGKSKSAASADSFLPHTLIGWAIIILIIFIIVVGWRAWKAKQEAGHH